MNEVDRKRLKCLIDITLLIGAISHEDRRITFGKFGAYFILLMLVCPFLVFFWITIMFMCRCDEGQSECPTLEAGNTSTQKCSRFFASSRIS